MRHVTICHYQIVELPLLKRFRLGISSSFLLSVDLWMCYALRKYFSSLGGINKEIKLRFYTDDSTFIPLISK